MGEVAEGEWLSPFIKSTSLPLPQENTLLLPKGVLDGTLSSSPTTVQEKE
jgi:hypothetical protein